VPPPPIAPGSPPDSHTAMRWSSGGTGTGAGPGPRGGGAGGGAPAAGPAPPARPGRPRGGRRFDPARLFLGLALLVLAGALAARAGGELEIRLGILAAALPAALVVTAVIAIVTHMVRRRGAAAAPGDGRADGAD
jgi:hypothetical protein